MKVRFGFGLGPTADVVDGPAFTGLVDALEARGFDSLWLSERVTGPGPEPLTALAVAAGRTRRLKLGTSVLVLPGRNPVLLASVLATLDRLSEGRLLPAVGLGVVDPAEQQAFGVDRADRAPWFEEALPLVRRLLGGDPVTHHGERFHLDGVQVRPTPVQAAMDIWLGGRSPAELRRVGRLGDGWLASFVTPAEAADGRRAVEEAAETAGRFLDPEHFGVVLPYLSPVTGPAPEATPAVPPALARRLAARRPDTDPTELVAVGAPGLQRAAERYVEAGVSKFVLVPVTSPPGGWDAELAALAEVVLPLQAPGALPGI